MKPVLRIFATLLAITGILSFSACTTMSPNETSSIGGTGSEVVGVVNYPDSGAAGKIHAGMATYRFPLIDGAVFINPVNYLPETGNAGETSVAHTREDGSFCISNVKAGSHILYIRDNGDNAVAYRVTVNEGDERVDVGTLVAKKTAGVSIAYSGTTPGEVLFFINLLGTGMQLRCASRNLQFTLDRIPVGIDYTVVIRMYKPFRKDYDFALTDPRPGITSTLQSITGE